MIAFIFCNCKVIKYKKPVQCLMSHCCNYIPGWTSASTSVMSYEMFLFGCVHWRERIELQLSHPQSNS